MHDTLTGRRRPDVCIGELPTDTEPGDYWRVLHRTTGEPLDVRTPEDQRWWAADDARFSQNLTGGVWGVIDPVGRYGVLSIHTVREHEDGTISVRPGDGSSNSILISGGPELDPPWHGYIERGEWRRA